MVANPELTQPQHYVWDLVGHFSPLMISLSHAVTSGEMFMCTDTVCKCSDSEELCEL